MDRQEKKKTEGASENGSENGSPEDSDVEEKVSRLLLLSCRRNLHDDNLIKFDSSTLVIENSLNSEMANSRHQKNKSFTQ